MTMNVSIAGLLVASALVVVIWFAFVAPSERRYHERKLKIVQERLERRRERLNEERPGRPAQSAGRSADMSDEAERQ